MGVWGNLFPHVWGGAQSRLRRDAKGGLAPLVGRTCRAKQLLQKQRPRNQRLRGPKETGNVLLSHGRVTIVPSTSVGLTAVFGMGTGVTPPVKLPEKLMTDPSLSLGINEIY